MSYDNASKTSERFFGNGKNMQQFNLVDLEHELSNTNNLHITLNQGRNTIYNMNNTFQVNRPQKKNFTLNVNPESNASESLDDSNDE